MTEFTERVIAAIKKIPPARVCTYGGIAALAGNPSGARQVVRILNSMSRAHDLPWHRIINSRGRIAIKDADGFALQKSLLEQESVAVSAQGDVDLSNYLWRG